MEVVGLEACIPQGFETRAPNSWRTGGGGEHHVSGQHKSPILLTPLGMTDSPLGQSLLWEQVLAWFHPRLRRICPPPCTSVPSSAVTPPESPPSDAGYSITGLLGFSTTSQRKPEPPGWGMGQLGKGAGEFGALRGAGGI